MSRLFGFFTLWIIDRRWLAVLVMLLITGIAITGYVRPMLVHDWIQSFNQDNPEVDLESSDDLFEGVSGPVPAVETFDITQADAIVVVQSDSIFTPTGADAMRAMVAELEAMDHVYRVTWMDKVPGLNIFGLPEPVLPSANASPNRFATSRKKALENPFVGGQLLSRDARTAVLLIQFEFFFITDDEDCLSGLSQLAREVAARFDGFDADVVTTGRVPIYLTIAQMHESNRLKFQIIAYSLIGLLSIILFRGITAVGIVGLAPALGVFWSLGVIKLFDFHDSPFIDVILPLMISVVGFTDGVHLMVQIRKLRSAGVAPREAARQGIALVGLACALTSLTTAIGFGSLTLAHHVLVREFGWSCVIGVTLTFVAVITTIPLLSSTWLLGRRVQIGHSKGLIDRNLGRIELVVDLVLRHINKFAFAGIGLTILLVGLCATLRPDEKRMDLLPSSSEASIGLRRLDEAMGGLEFVSIHISWSRNVPSDSKQVIEVTQRLGQLLKQEPLIGSPLSICDFIDALPGEGAAADRMSLLELLPPPVKREFYQPELRNSTIHFRVRDLGVAAYAPIFQKIQDEIHAIEAESDDFRIYMSGRPIENWQNLFQITMDLVTSLGTASVVIFVVLGLVYRSLRIGLISIIPNVFPLAVAGSFLVFSGMSLEVISVCAFTVCLGIAVDDTIHFLTRYQEEMDKTTDEKLAIRKAFTSVGTALIMTTLVLVAGLLSVLFSDSRDHRVFAIMGAITVGAALFGDILFLPAILAKFGRSKSGPTNAAKPDQASQS